MYGGIAPDFIQDDRRRIAAHMDEEDPQWIKIKYK